MLGNNYRYMFIHARNPKHAPSVQVVRSCVQLLEQHSIIEENSVIPSVWEKIVEKNQSFTMNFIPTRDFKGKLQEFIGKSLNGLELFMTTGGDYAPASPRRERFSFHVLGIEMFMDEGPEPGAFVKWFETNYIAVLGDLESILKTNIEISCVDETMWDIFA